jgi:hypothetical protein
MCRVVALQQHPSIHASIHSCLDPFMPRSIHASIHSCLDPFIYPYLLLIEASIQDALCIQACLARPPPRPSTHDSSPFSNPSLPQSPDEKNRSREGGRSHAKIESFNQTQPWPGWGRVWTCDMPAKGRVVAHCARLELTATPRPGPQVHPLQL